MSSRWLGRLGVRVIASNAPAYARPEQRQILDVFTCIREHTTIEEAGKLLSLNSERYLRSGREMARRFADIPQAVSNTLELSAQLAYSMDAIGYEFPPYPVPDGESMASFLRKRVDEGARNRYRPFTRKQDNRSNANSS